MVKRISENKTLLRNIMTEQYDQCDPKQKRDEVRHYGMESRSWVPVETRRGSRD